MRGGGLPGLPPVNLSHKTLMKLLKFSDSTHTNHEQMFPFSGER